MLGKRKPLRLSRGLLWANKPAWHGAADGDYAGTQVALARSYL